MRLLVGLGLVAACTPKPPEALPRVTNAAAAAAATHPVAVSHDTSAPRPELQIDGIVPDFHELLRWPLTAMSHPALAPQYDIADVFAEPGVDWIELCNRGAQNRSLGGRYTDELQYLRGWCHALKRDTDTALGELTPLLHSHVRGLPDAVRIDIANIIVDGGDAERAEHWLSRHRIDDLTTLDTLGAAYVEVGKEADALQLNTRLLGMSRTESEQDKCRRITKQIVLGPEGSRPENLAMLEAAATKPKVPDRVCVELFHEVRCWRDPANDCAQHISDENLVWQYTDLLWLAYRWPKHAAIYTTWVTVANHAWSAVTVAGAETALLVALDAAERTGASCSDDMRAIIAGAIKHPGISDTTRSALVGFQDRCDKHRSSEKSASMPVCARGTCTSD